MDAKQVLALLKKHHFWIIAVIVLLTATAFWYTTTASLAQQFQDRKTQIESDFQTAQKIQTTTPHPNDLVHKEMEVLVQALQTNVGNVWNEQYQHQVNSILTWPEELGPEFIRRVTPMRPIESAVSPDAAVEPLHQQFREIYRDYIKQELPKLAETIGATWKAKRGGGGGGSGAYAEYGADGGGDEAMTMMGDGYGGSGGAAKANEPKYIVHWAESDQTRLQNSRFDWSTGGAKMPTTAQVLYAQEDLWVLQAMMQIIANTNEGADSHFKAAIKTLTSIEMGPDVKGRRGQVMSASRANTGGSMESGMESGMESMAADYGSDPMAMEADAAMGGSADGGGQAAGPDPANYRYVDKDYKPLTAEELRSAQSGTDAAKAYLAVAKRMPIRVSVVMDQRKIHKLLVECGNSPLPVEVRQVRINRTGRGGGGGGYGGGGGSFGADTEGASYGGGGGGGQTANNVKYDLPVEIYGIVYIYNPVNPQQLGIEQGQGAIAMNP